jgi:hypothetical protein
MLYFQVFRSCGGNGIMTLRRSTRAIQRTSAIRNSIPRYSRARCFLFGVFFIPFVPGLDVFHSPVLPPVCEAAQKQNYLSKDYIDSIVQQAFYNLNTAMTIPGAEFIRKNAIDEGKRTAAALKKKAAGDPNEKYILFRVNELEQQLWLEEKDLVLKGMKKTQIVKNKYIDTFNVELGQKRPDFANLSRLTSIMLQLDGAKGDELRRSMAQRRTNIRREVSFHIDRSLVSGDLGAAAGDFAYCGRNRSFLSIPDSVFDRTGKRIQGQADAMKKKPSLDAGLRRASEWLAKNRLKEAGECISAAAALLGEMQGNLPLSEWNTYDGLYHSVSAQARQKDDSLVNTAIVLYNTKGEDSALAYIEKVLKKSGMSQAGIAQASTYVLSRGAQLPKRDSTISRQVDSCAGAPGPLDISLDKIREAAKKKARERADSARAAGEEKAGSCLLDVYSLLENGLTETAYSRFMKNRTLLESYVYKDAFDALATAVMHAYDARNAGQEDQKPAVAVSHSASGPEDVKANQDKAEKHISLIYAMIEKGKSEDAYRHFNRFRDKLKQYLCREAFDMVEASVNQAYAPAAVPDQTHR